MSSEQNNKNSIIKLIATDESPDNEVNENDFSE